MSKSGAPLGTSRSGLRAAEGLRSSYSLGMPTRRASSRSCDVTLPCERVAREVVDQPLEFPAALVWVAETRCRQLDAARISPVDRVATDEGWFTD